MFMIKPSKYFYFYVVYYFTESREDIWYMEENVIIFNKILIEIIFGKYENFSYTLSLLMVWEVGRGVDKLRFISLVMQWMLSLRASTENL